MKRTLLASAIIGVLGMTSSYASATTQIHATACSLWASSQGVPGSGAFGWYNSAGSGTVGIQCGLPTQAGDTFRQVTAVVFDRNPDLDISCEAYGLDRNGVFVWDSTAKSSSGSGQASQTIVFNTPPPPTSAIYYMVQCTIPAAFNGNFSHVTAFFVD